MEFNGFKDFIGRCEIHTAVGAWRANIVNVINDRHGLPVVLISDKGEYYNWNHIVKYTKVADGQQQT